MKWKWKFVQTQVEEQISPEMTELIGAEVLKLKLEFKH